MDSIQKWGDSLAVRIPAAFAEQLQVKAGTPVEIRARNGEIVVRPKQRPTYRLSELLIDCRPDQLHGELDFGPDGAREVID